MQSLIESLLTTHTDYLKGVVAPQATEIDLNPTALKQALQGLGDRRLLGLKIPQKYGGVGMEEIQYRQMQMATASYSGALAFLQAQHQSAGSMLAACRNESLKQTYLPHMSTGKILVGVGFSHLRRRHHPPMGATETADGYLLSGTVPWITGWDMFQDFIVGATLPDGRELYGILPFKSCSSAGGRIEISAPMQLMAMGSTNTVSAQIKDWYLEGDRLLQIKPSGAIEQSSRKNVLNHGFFALGCAQGALRILQQQAETKGLQFLHQAYDQLQRESAKLQHQMVTIEPWDSFELKLKLRAKAINLAGRCTQAAVIASSGAANSLAHPAQRLYREALVFSVSGQTLEVMEASLESLLH